MSADTQHALPSGLVAFVKRECPTCELVAPVLSEIAKHSNLTIYSQDDPSFPSGLAVRDDRDLSHSWHQHIEVVPTLLRVDASGEVSRVIGWHRGEWETLSGVSDLGSGLPETRPGCGSLSVDPDRVPALRARFLGDTLQARRVEIADLEDASEAMYERGWTDGLPVVEPTKERVLAMLEGTTRVPDDIVAVVPPDLVPCTVEKVAINAVMAGCRPEYLPVVIAALEAACTDRFNMHGVLATTMGVGPVVIVSGPIRRAIGMNTGMNVLAQGNRAASTIGRALQLVVRNVGGGRPGEVDRATFGNPGKLSFCFAEDEEDSPWTSLAADFGVEAGESAVTLFAGEGARNVMDQRSRDPESLARTYAVNLQTIHHPKLVMAFDVILVVGPEHGRVFREAGWSKDQLKERLHELLLTPGGQLVQGADGIAEGMPAALCERPLPKFRPGGLHIVYAGGRAGLFSAIIGGWVNGDMGSQPVCRRIST